MATTILFFTCIAAAAFFKAVMDTLSFHFETSVFRWKDPRFWNPAISWQHTGFIRFTKYRPDAWHLAGTGMICCFLAAGLFPAPVLPWWAQFLISGLVHNGSFNLFYNKILRKP